MLESTAIKSAIHWMSGTLETPAIIILIIGVGITLVELGSIVVEFVAERRFSRVDVRGLLVAMQGKNREGILAEIMKSDFLRHKKSAFRSLLTTKLPRESTEALAARLISGEELRCHRVVQVTDIIARVAPMFGLMATLIPLGPGLIALGQGDTKTLAESLLTAFDATVSGLAAAGVAYIISRIRKRWYENDLASMEAVMESVLSTLFPMTVISRSAAQPGAPQPAAPQPAAAQPAAPKADSPVHQTQVAGPELKGGYSL